MNRQLKQLSLGTLLGFTLLVAGCGESGSSAISQQSGAVAPVALKAEAEVPAERGAETTVATGDLGRVETPSGDVTMERCMAQRRYLVFHTDEALDTVNDTNGERCLSARSVDRHGDLGEQELGGRGRQWGQLQCHHLLGWQAYRVPVPSQRSGGG